MNKIIVFFIIMVIFLFSCSIGPVYTYNFQPVLDFEGDTAQVIFRVPDLEPDGWWNGDGEANKTYALTIRETKGTNAYITDIIWNIVGADNSLISQNRIMLTKSFILNKTDSILNITMTLYENDAIDLDEADGTIDNVGEGVIIIYIDFYDESGNKYESKPYYIPIKVLKP